MNDKTDPIIINGNRFAFEPGETILEVARRNSIDIPTLCHLKGASPTGACRVCVVEVQGARSLVASCAMPAAPRMVVQTESPKVVAARRMVIQLLLASGNHNCAVRGSDGRNWTDFQMTVQRADGSQELCPVWGDCRLQDLAYRYQVNGERFEPTPPRYPIEDVNPFIVRDFSRCIQCGRCVQACNEIQVNQAIHFGYRGSRSKIIAAGDRPYRDSDCIFCGECVQACPTGALMPASLVDVRGHGDSAATDRKVDSVCPYCGVGCQLTYHVRDDLVVNVEGRNGPSNLGRLCVKGRFGLDYTRHPARLLRPLIRREGVPKGIDPGFDPARPLTHFREASWDEALDLAAGALKALRDAHGPAALAGFGSAKCSNEEAWLFQKLVRTGFGSNNVDHCTRLCHASSVAALMECIGSGAVTASFMRAPGASEAPHIPVPKGPVEVW